MKTLITKNILQEGLPFIGFDIGCGNGMKVNIGEEEFKYRPEVIS